MFSRETFGPNACNLARVPVPAAIFLCLSPVAIDGDTLRCANVEQAKGRVRLARIDAPERGQPGSKEATAALAAMIEQGPVRCTPVDADPRRAGYQSTDPFGRIVARCRVGRADLGAAMKRQGHAVVWPRRSATR